MMGVRITPTTIKVSRPGVDPATAGFDDLFLSIGMRTGQILQSGSFGLTGSGPSSLYNGAGNFPAFPQAPDVVGYAVSADGRVHWPPALPNINTSTGTSTVPGALVQLWVTQSSDIDVNSITVSGFKSSGPGPEPASYTYVIFRKPNRS